MKVELIIKKQVSMADARYHLMTSEDERVWSSTLCSNSHTSSQQTHMLVVFSLRAVSWQESHKIQYDVHDYVCHLCVESS